MVGFSPLNYQYSDQIEVNILCKRTSDIQSIVHYKL